MSFEGPKRNNSLDEPANPGRRKFLLGAAAFAGAAAVGAGMYKMGSSQMDSYRKQIADREDKEKPFTHTGKALIVNKLEKSDARAPSAAEIASGALEGYQMSGYDGAVMMAGSLR
ncbi:MAG TPA: hypothetical protein VG102_02425 [Candidatus Paceibacterota bacterium]|jgi:hypothetical protein|nr:hypothetical protein [Candidatus Paceibacterota bacterium]